jgi:hypothetical protein
MLKKKYESVLKVLNDNAYKGESLIISPSSIVAFCGNEKLVNDKNVEDVLKSLCSSDYIDMVLSDKKGETFYCITLLKKGKNYKQEKSQEIKNIKSRIILAVVCALVSFIVGKILIAIF